MARRIRIYHPEELVIDQQIHLSDVASKHLLQVLRLKPGSQFEVFDGKGNAFLAKYTGGAKKSLQATIIEAVESVLESPLAIHLGQAISKGDRMDYAIQKAVELGVHEITPLYTDNTQLKYTAERLVKKLKHWQGIIIHAAQQSGRSYLPKLHAPMSFNQWLAEQPIAFMCAIQHNPLHNPPETLNQVSVCIGPEGGWSQNELAYDRQHNIYSFNLGPRILRTETAVPVALTLLQCLWGDVPCKPFL